MDCRTQLASMAIEELDKGDFLMATKILTTSIKLEPSNHELYFERSICNHKLGNYQASLDDANAAIRLNSTDYNIHYQKGLALIGLSMFSDAVTSFKKAIELRAKQDDSKLSDIFKLLRDATNELNTARRKPGNTSGQQTASTPSHASTSSAALDKTSNNDPVDSTTDKPIKSTSNHHMIDANNQGETHVTKADNTSVVASKSNNMASSATQVLNNPLSTTGRVSSSAGQFKINVENRISTLSNLQHHRHQLNALSSPSIDHQHDQIKSGSLFEWNIRRSERIFLHNTNEPGTSGSQHDESFKQKVGSNPSSVSSGKGANKRSLDQHNGTMTQSSSRTFKTKESSNSIVDSDVDVDGDSTCFNGSSHQNIDMNQQSIKRVMVTPSSSMPATSHSSTSATTKEDSYSSKYKRLRRDRERARRGTSKLCTIKPSDLDDLRKASNSDSEKRLMRVIAPIDGWLYSGQLSFDDTHDSSSAPHYVVKLDGDTTGSSYLFTQETVLNDVIKEVRVKSVSELRKGARICCYWSRTYKCLSTGVVTSRTFEATKSLVSVKYDNGDLSALPLEDLRLLPPDYPKYMSNCDPLLLARSGDSADTSGSSRIVVNCKSVVTANPNFRQNPTAVPAIRNSVIHICDFDNTSQKDETDNGLSLTTECQNMVKDDKDHDEESGRNSATLFDETIPPTNEAIKIITSESDNDHQDESIDEKIIVDQIDVNGKDNSDSSNGTLIDTSRASSEENNYGVEYRPWVFEGSPKRSKRNGRIYRDNYSAIRRGNEVLRVGDSAELMPRDESVLPFIAKIDGIWANTRAEMRVRVRWYYRLIETEGEPNELSDGQNALFETDHFDENDVQSIWRSTKILTWTEYSKDHIGHANTPTEGPKIFYLAGYYDPVRRTKHLRSDVKGIAIN